MPSYSSWPGEEPGIPLKGVFATRSPNRPNPIGKATVRLLQRQGNILKVEGLDAIDGTPIIDIKPYILDMIRRLMPKYPHGQSINKQSITGCL